VLSDYRIIEHELSEHAAELAERPRVIIGNKLDTESAPERSATLARFAEQAGLPYFAVSAVTGEGMDQMTRAVADRVRTLRREAAFLLRARTAELERYEARYIHQQVADGQKRFTVANQGGGVFTVTGKAVERMVVQTEWDNEEALIYLQGRLLRAGVEQALIEAGACEGDEVRIAGRAFMFEPSLPPPTAKGGQ
jgi:GTP-binding protein